MWTKCIQWFKFNPLKDRFHTKWRIWFPIKLTIFNCMGDERWVCVVYLGLKGKMCAVTTDKVLGLSFPLVRFPASLAFGSGFGNLTSFPPPQLHSAHQYPVPCKIGLNVQKVGNILPIKRQTTSHLASSKCVHCFERASVSFQKGQVPPCSSNFLSEFR